MSQKRCAPEISEGRRAEALELATEARSKRRKLLEDVRSGRYDLTDILEMEDKGDKIAGRTKVSSILMAIPGIGKAKTSLIMEGCKIPNKKRIQGLGKRQRASLCDAVQELNIKQ